MTLSCIVRCCGNSPEIAFSWKLATNAVCYTPLPRKAFAKSGRFSRRPNFIREPIGEIVFQRPPLSDKLLDRITSKLLWRNTTLSVNENLIRISTLSKEAFFNVFVLFTWVAVITAKNHKRQRRKRQFVTAKREKTQTPKVLTTILTLLNLT